ncbi:MAG: tetratricopeptide repeat protein [Chloroflexi bacterium]|nr:tetratricopeptide repeat protein [Chloroflexota bacterium]
MAKPKKSRIKKLGKLGLAILEHRIEKVIGNNAVDMLKAAHKDHEALISALTNTERRFRDEFDDKELVKAMFDDLSLENLPSLDEAFSKFYSRPTDPSLPQTLMRFMRSDFPSLPEGRLLNATREYIIIFTEELAMVDEKFRDDAEALANIRSHHDQAQFFKDIRGLFEKEKAPKISPPDTLQSLHQIPPPPADFTGREEELGELRQALTEGGAAISGVRGMGGIGKTVLALVLAQELKDSYPDAQIFLDLQGAHKQEPLTPAEVLTYVVRAFHPTAQLPEDVKQLRALFLSTLEGQQVLILMDNALDAEQVRPILPPMGCCLLVTSRQHFTLPGLIALDLDRMSPEDASELLLTIAPRIGEHTAEIARLCAYLPLALRLAATALAETLNLSPEEYIERLQDEQTRAELVEASLKLSYDLLDESLQTHWRALGVFPGGFDQAAAEAVWELEEDKTQDALSSLLRYSMLDYDQTTQRYRLHDLARDSAAKMLGEYEEEEKTYRFRHATHYLNILTAADSLYLKGGEGVLAGLALYDREARNITAGQAWAATQMEEYENVSFLINYYSGAAGSILNFRLHPQKWISWLDAGLTAAESLGDKNAQSNHLGNLGIAYYDLGETRWAIEYHERALVISQEMEDKWAEGQDLINLGNAYVALGEPRRAIEYFEKAISIRQVIEDKRTEGQVLSGLGNAYTVLGDPRKAIEYHEKAHIISQKIKDKRAEGQDLGNLGIAYNKLGEFPKAIEYYEQQLKIAKELSDRRGEGNALGNLGNAYKNLGETSRAIEYYEQQLEIAKETSDRRGEGNALWNTAIAFAELGQPEQAIESAATALEIYEQIEAPYAEMVRKKLAEWRGE